MIKYLFMIFLVLGLISCGGDDDCCEVGDEETLINYDGDNANAPNLPAGNFVFAIRLPLTTLNRLEGQNITAVSVFMYDIPSDVDLVIYNEINNLPSRELYTQDITSTLSPNGWNSIALDTPFPVTGTTLWVGLDIDNQQMMQSIGCDLGPANVNGDWLFDGTDGEFIRFTNRVNDSVNWNIRVTVGQ
jgi:hypothetical protein